MSSAEFSVWLAMYKRAPWDERRLDIGFGQVAATVANYAGKIRAENAEQASPLDFMLFEASHSDQEKTNEVDPVTFFRALN